MHIDEHRNTRRVIFPVETLIMKTFETDLGVFDW